MTVIAVVASQPVGAAGRASEAAVLEARRPAYYRPNRYRWRSGRRRGRITSASAAVGRTRAGGGRVPPPESQRSPAKGGRDAGRAVVAPDHDVGARPVPGDVRVVSGEHVVLDDVLARRRAARPGRDDDAAGPLGRPAGHVVGNR